MNTLRFQRKAPVYLILAGMIATPQAGFAQAPGTVDLLATPPEITASVAPNVVLTFDDSGSMAWEYMPDQRPYLATRTDWVADVGTPTATGTDRTHPWLCAGLIDARVTDVTNPRSKPMNGMFYDPNVTYRPPLYSDGVTEMPTSPYTAVRNDGIEHNRPDAPITSGTRNLSTARFCGAYESSYHLLASGSYNQNWNNIALITTIRNWNGHPAVIGYRGDRTGNTVNVDPRTLLTLGNTTTSLYDDNITPSSATVLDGTNTVAAGGVFEIQGGTEIGGNPTIAFQGNDTADAPVLLLRINTTNCTGIKLSYRLRDIDNASTAVQQVAVQARVGSSANFTNIAYFANANNNSSTNASFDFDSSFDNKPRIQIRWMTTNATGEDNMVGIDDISVTGTCTPAPAATPAGGGYYVLKTGVSLNEDTFGRITNPEVLYNVNNWEWIPLPASQQQNFANWHSYYRTRTDAARTAMSRAFAPFDESIRVAWQNLGFNSDCIVAGRCGSIIDAPVLGATPGNSTVNPPIPATPPTPIFAFANPSTARTNFYKWLFQIPASGGTPNIAASIRVGEYFKTSSPGLAVDSNPYWDRTLNRELSCRQNFHINMSDGFWNSINSNEPVGTLHAPSGTWLRSTTNLTLPDGRAYNTATAESKIITNYSGTAVTPTMNDIMFHYWATDLRPDFTAQDATRLKVPPFIPDRSTNLFGIPVGSGQDPRDNKEVYWNPANDPATWSHLVNFNISFGLDGTLPNTPEVYSELRRGTATWQWPYPVINTDDGRKLDDFWHAALSSRGRFLSAKNPEQLINALQEVIASIVARRGASTAVSVSLPIITDGTTGYTAGYDTTDWSGFVTRNRLDPNTAERIGIQWDAGCILTGGACSSTAQTGLPVRDPETRVIVTSDGIPGSGKAFRWANLSTAQQSRLNVNPATLNLITNSRTTDGFGANRVDYVRGSRVNEATPSPRFRARSSVLGSVIRGQPIFVSSPSSGFRDIYPATSPEGIAANANPSRGYQQYQVDQRARRPTVFVAANDGMLHAFDAADGKEAWAYVPNIVIDNYRLTKSTQFESGFTPSVDDKPVVSDAFINGAWKTVLVGSLRLGGRGVYALDITTAERGGALTESAVRSKVLWEFSDVAPAGYSGTDCAAGSRFCSSLGYTYDAVNIARLKHSNKWVALVSSGYFPKNGQDPASLSTAAARTSLLVIDLQTGTLIREIRTNTAPQVATTSFGMSQAIVYDKDNDLIDDIAYAGDLAGNMWRFDLTADSPSNWKVDLMFQSYGNGGTTSPGEQPISSAPITMVDRTLGIPMLVFGTGKFIGADDRTSAIPTQAHYGIRDYGTCNSLSNPTACANYPIKVNQLISQVMTQDSNAVRRITSAFTVPVGNRGWRIPINITSEAGERAFATPFPFYSSNQVLLRSIIPKGIDPCDPGARYGLVVVNASDGTAYVDPAAASPQRIVGGVVASSTPPGDPITLRGGGAVVFAGLTERDGTGAIVNQAAVNAITSAASNADDIWHRGAWRELLDQM